MAVTFMILKENGNVVLRQAVRIAKKNLVFSEAVDGDKKVAKGRCFHYTNEQENDYKNLKRISLKLKRLKKEVRDVEAIKRKIGKLEEEKEVFLGKFKKVTVKSSRF